MMVFGAGIIIAAILLSGIFIPMTAMGTKEKSVSFDQHTFELVPGVSQSLRGVDSFIECSDGRVVDGPLFDLFAIREKPSATGAWTMIAAPGAAAGDSGTIEKAQIASKHFRLKGTWDNFGRDNVIICGESTLPAQVILQGSCGLGVTIQLRASNGINGAFKGDVNCH